MTFTERQTVFCHKVLAAEREGEIGQLEAGLQLWQEALDSAENDFQRSYVWGAIAAEQAALNRFEEAAASWRRGLALAQQLAWPEFVESYSLNLGNIYAHLARFRESETFLKSVLEKYPEGSSHEWIGLNQNLGAALIEEGKYREAAEVFSRCLQVIAANGNPLEQAIANLHLARAYNGMGMTAESSRCLEEAQAGIEKGKFDALLPFLKLTLGRFELIQGSLSSGFRLLEEAALGFEAKGDLSGKVEVLLQLSAPLLEQQLIKEAQGLIEQLAAWEDLLKYPALQQAIRLRRLALAAFSGNWVQEDIQILSKTQDVGRFDDWLQFWFHLTLAAGRLPRPDLARSFLGMAKALMDHTYRELLPEQKKFFLSRPDIARLLRLDAPQSSESRELPKVRARRALPSSDPAEAASLAPPIKSED